MARSHALAVEPVPVVEAHREWVVTELTIEHPVDPAERSFAVADANRHEIRSVENATPDALRPLAALLGTRKHGDQAIAEALLEATHDPGVEEEPDRELVGKDEPDRARHHELPSSASIRAGDRGSVEPVRAERLGRRSARRPALDTEHGDVPAELSAQRVAEPADRGVILEDDDALVGIELAQPVVSRSDSATACSRPEGRGLARRGARTP